MICGGGGKKTHNANTKYNYIIIIIYNMPLPAAVVGQNIVFDRRPSIRGN